LLYHKNVPDDETKFDLITYDEDLDSL